MQEVRIEAALCGRSKLERVELKAQITFHDYEWQRDRLIDRYKDIVSTTNSMPAKRSLFVGGARYKGEPILVTEFGGIAYKKSHWDGWGYSGATSDEDFIQRLDDVFDPLHDSPVVVGYCYTQFTDVEQEINGLLTYDRKPTVPLAEIRRINRA